MSAGAVSGDHEKGAHFSPVGSSEAVDEAPPAVEGGHMPRHMAVAAHPHAAAPESGDAVRVRRPAWPASRRARAVARRRARALTPATATAALSAGAGVPPVGPSRDAARAGLADPAIEPRSDAAARHGRTAGPPGPPRPPRRATPPRLQRRRRILLTGIGVLTAAGVALAVAGVTLVRHSTAGRYIEGAGPDDPGYEAFVVPTPVMALFQRGADGELAGVAVLALESRDGNGSVVLVPPSTLAGAPGAESTLAATYRDRGAEGLVAVLANLLGTAIPEHLELDDARWASLVTPVAPVQLQLDEAVGDWPAGDVSLAADDVGPFLAALAAGESDPDRIDRQETFWTAWLPLIREAGDGALPGEIDVGIGRFVRGLADGEASIAPLPVVTATHGDADVPTTFRVNGERLSEVVARAVPYPESPAPDRRIRVRLLNGTSDADLTSVASSRLVEGGAQISIVGNAGSFDVAETHMIYGAAEQRVKAEWLSATFGGAPIGEDPASQQADDADEDIDVTVILGADARDLIGR